MITKQACREQNWEKKKEDGTTTPTTKPLCKKEQSEETYLGNTSIKIAFAVATGGTRAKMKAKDMATASLRDAPAFALKAIAFNAMELNQSRFLGSGKSAMFWRLDVTSMCELESVMSFTQSQATLTVT